MWMGEETARRECGKWAACVGYWCMQHVCWARTTLACTLLPVLKV